MTIGGAFLGGGVEVVPAGSCKLEFAIVTEDRKNLGATFTISGGGQTYTVTAGADGRAVKTVPSGVTYTVSVNSSGYVNVSSQTVVAESATVKYVRFDAIKDRVDKVSDETIGGTKTFTSTPLIPTPSTSATGREAVNAEWVNTKLASKQSAIQKIALDITKNDGGAVRINNAQAGDIIYLDITPNSDEWPYPVKFHFMFNGGEDGAQIGSIMYYMSGTTMFLLSPAVSVSGSNIRVSLPKKQINWSSSSVSSTNLVFNLVSVTGYLIRM